MRRLVVSFDSYFRAANIEYYYYDQLGSAVTNPTSQSCGICRVFGKVLRPQLTAEAAAARTAPS